MPKIAVQLVADTVAYTRGLKKAAGETELFGTTASRSFEHVGRSLALMTGGFVAFSGATEFLKASIDAARDAGVAQRSLAAQIKASGDSFTASQAAIEKAELSLEKYGFTSEDSAKALTVLERGTGNITQAIGLQSTAADLARAKNIDLASAAAVLAKVFGGQETALRRAVPGLDKQAHGLDLIAQAQQRLAGQAKAGTTEAEKFHATLHDTEVIIGTALLPTINKYLGELGDWLDKMNRSGKLQKDVNGVVKTATGIFKAVLAIVKPLAAAFKILGDAVGGTENEVKLLLSLGIAAKLSGIAGGFKTAGAEAEYARGRTVAFGGALRGLPATVGTTILIEALVNKQPIDDWLKSHHLGFATKGIIPDLLGLVGIGGGGGAPASGGIPGLTGPAGTPIVSLTGPVGVPSVNVPGRVAGQTFQNGQLTPAQSRAIGLASDPNNLALLRAQAAHDQAALAFAQKLRSSGRISNAKYVTEVTAYASDLKQTNDTITSILQAAADTRTSAAQARQQAAQDARQAAIDTKMGWLQFAIERAGATKTIKDDVKAYGALETFLKQRIRQEGRTLDLVRQLWEARQAVRDLNKNKAAKAKADGDPLAGLVQVSSRRLANILAAGTGLDLAGRRRLVANIGGAEIQPLHVHVNLDGREVAEVVTKHQARSGRRTGKQTSGFRG